MGNVKDFNGVIVEMSALVNVPPSALNRGEFGEIKTCSFGNIPRTRVSSQSQKYAMKQSSLFKELSEGIGLCVRSANLHKGIIKAFPEILDMHKNASIVLMNLCDDLGKKPKKSSVTYNTAKDIFDFSKITEKELKDKIEKIEDLEANSERNAQIIVSSQEEFDLLIETIIKLVKDCEGDIAKFACVSNKLVFERMAAFNVNKVNLDNALFGSMSASPYSSTLPAAMSVADMISTNEHIPETDFFIASDDFNVDSNAAASMGNTEFASSCYYKYAVIDVGLLRDTLSHHRNSNFEFDMEGDISELVQDVVSVATRLFIESLPKGGQTNHLTSVKPDFVYVTVRDAKTSNSYTNAFVTPITTNASGNLIENSIKAIVREINKLEIGYADESVTTKSFCMNFATDDIPEYAKSVNNITELINEMKSLI